MQHLVAISSPENMARLDEIRANNAKLTDPRKTSAAEAIADYQYALTLEPDKKDTIEPLISKAREIKNL